MLWESDDGRVLHGVEDTQQGEQVFEVVRAGGGVQYNRPPGGLLDQAVLRPPGTVAEHARLDVSVVEEPLEDRESFSLERAALLATEAAGFDDVHGRITFGSRVPNSPIAEWMRFQA